MQALQRLLANQPIVIGNFVGAVISLLVVLGLPVDGEVKTAIVTLVIAATTLFAHQSVVSPASALAMVQDAACGTAAALGEDNVGVRGDVTESAQRTVRMVVNGVVENMGGLVSGTAGAVLEEERGHP